MNTWPKRRSHLPPDALVVVENCRATRDESREARLQLERSKTELAIVIRQCIDRIGARDRTDSRAQGTSGGI